MNGKQRFLAAMEGLPVDRVPVTFYAHKNGAQAHIDWVRSTGMDGIAVEPEGYYGVHRQVDFPLHTLADLRRLRPFAKDHPYIAGQVDCAARVCEAVGQDTAVFTMLFTPFSVIKHTLGGEHAVMELYREDPQSFCQVMDVMEQNNLTLMESLKERTALDGLFISFQNAEKWRFTPGEYQALLSPYDARLLQAAQSAYTHNIFHLCSWGNEPNHIGLWQHYDFGTVNWGVFQEENLSLRQGRSFFRPGTTVMGGFDRLPQGVLHSGSREEIIAFTHNLIRETGSERLILCADCSVEHDVPDEHIRWVIEAASAFASTERSLSE